MNSNKGYIVFIFFIIIFFSCTSEIARVDVFKNKNVSIQVDCEKQQEIDLYIDCDIEYTELPLMVMDFEFYRGEEQLIKGGLDPLLASPKLDEVKTELDGVTHWKFYGKLEGNFIPPSDGVFSIRPTLIKNNHPNLKVNKFELVLVR
ncbi:hypothetical protein FRY74_01185 [Vicingus serpentipes]|uniref:Gliding motility lipoprotein GldH n=1 Tax=Vicingus serpentipes TaxID=1926625 RepID=A0A5C6RXJ1_9FLAO|nr:hypothetical protein [Vicingus serpentipes]TXB66827.1 hypothetical protein FRY74_01185 [Vicingus serpentipes]